MLFLKSRKISLKIAAVTGIVEIFAMTLLFLIINQNLTKVLEKKAMDDMNVIAADRAQLVETYILSCCDFISGYSKVPEVRNFYNNRNDKAALKSLHDFTASYASLHEHIEGLYLAAWDTYVFEHTNPDSVNKAFRSKEAARQLEERIKSEGKAFCSGVVLAPVSKKMVIPVYAPVYDDKNEAVAFAGAAFYTEELAGLLSSISSREIDYALLNLKTGQYIFNSDPSLVGSVCTNKDLLKAAEKKIPAYKTRDSVVSCHFMTDKNWIFVIQDSTKNVFGIIFWVRYIIGVICLLITVIMVLTCVFNVEYQMKPVRIINKQIEYFKARDYSHSDLVRQYLNREDEFGAIANAVKELHGVLQNQHQLFFEVLEAQTVGTLVTDFSDNNIIMVNNMALKLWGIDPAKRSSLQMEDIKKHFDENETRKIAEIREIAKKSKDEVVYETTAIHDDGQKVHLLCHAKGVNLSNGDKVIIFSFINISAQKKLEENLLELSETDSLTSICNRRSGESKVKKEILKGKKGLFALFDVNKFKFFNDNFGHAAGDKVLIEIAKCMKQTFRSSDILIRFGGDEFSVFATDIDSQKNAEMVLKRFLTNIAKINMAEINGNKISISLGAILLSESDDNFEELYKKADSLMYDCKKRGENAFKIIS